MFDSFAIGVVGLVALVALIAIRIPIAYSMIVVGFVGASALASPWIILLQLKQLLYAQFSNYDLSVLPLFVLMGALASRIGMSRDLFRAADAWLGRFTGGIAMATVLACGGFGAVCGSSTATALTMGQVALPELRRYKYSPALATGTLAAGGTLGILIPPSVVLIVYAIIVEANIVTLFEAALLPGILAVIFFMVAVRVYVGIVRGSGPKGEPVPRHEFVAATLGAVPIVAIFAVVIGGIYSGIYSPTPAAAIGVSLTALLGLARRRLDFKTLGAALEETVRTTGMVFLILVGAALLSIFMARAQVPQATAEMLATSGLPPMMIMVLIIVIFIFLGMLMDSLSMVILAIPFFWPVVLGLDFGLSENDLKIWFGIIALVVVELGLITPPVGLNVFVINSLAPDIPMRQTFKGVIPFLLSECVRVTLLVAFPVITLWLPHLLGA